MRVGFHVTLCDQIQRFEPLLRRTPGARFLVPAGRWPSAHRDSRAEIIRLLHASGLAPAISPRADFDLLVAGAESPESSLRAWLRPRGMRVLWHEPDTSPPSLTPCLTLCPGRAQLPADSAGLAQVVGDPALDLAVQAGARARALHRLGLAPDSERPVLLLHGESLSHGLDSLAGALASLRIDHDLLVSSTELRRLERHRALPSLLQGPGIHRLPHEFPLALALAASDLVLSDPGVLALQAAALDRPVLLLGSPRQIETVREIPLSSHSALRGLSWIRDAEGLHTAVDRALHSTHADRMEARALAEDVVGVVDGSATRRAVAALQILAAGDDLPRSATVA